VNIRKPRFETRQPAGVRVLRRCLGGHGTVTIRTGEVNQMTSRQLRSVAALGCVLTCMAFVTGSPVARGQEPATSRAMALTFDDLPFVAAGEAYFPAATRTTSELLRVLRRPGAGHARRRTRRPGARRVRRLDDDRDGSDG
jgi:hypothetical protein